MSREHVVVDIHPFDRALVKKSSFSCGKPELDTWLKHDAGQRERDSNTRTFLAVPTGADRVVGYYATTTYRLEPSELSIRMGAGRRSYPIPQSCWHGWRWTLTGRVAALVDNSWRMH